MSTDPSLPPQQRTTNAQDTRIAWRSYGPADATAVVMMHSLGSDGSMWAPQIHALSPDFRIAAVDTRGHGGSDAPAGPYAVEDLARDVLAVADAAGLERFHAVGLSLGGQMAMRLALQAPDRVQSVVLANTAAKLGTDESWQARIQAVTADGMTSVRDAVLGRWFAAGFPERHPAWFAQAQAVFAATDPVGYAGCCAALRDSDLRDAVQAIDVPALVIGGEFDLATPPAQAEWLHQHIAGSRLTIFTDAGHLSNLDRAPDFSELLRSFLST